MNIRPAVDWPAEGLESLGACPLCHSTKRRKLHEHLTDVTFFAAPGEWTLWRCLGCRSAYLDPRPNRETIGLAYGEYFTHSLIDPPGPETTMQRIRKNLANGYRNARYGTELTPAWKLGYLVAKLVPSLGKIVDVQFRYLPRASKSGARALDIGCGNGAWLSLAKSAGWAVSGVEPDPVALAQGRSHGLDVRPSLADFEADTAGFDYITLSHVIEHVHDPAATLRTCYKLLGPGGGIFVDTPNVDALGHDLYGRHWRGLEVPRHLVLFNSESLTRSLKAAGFVQLKHGIRRMFTGMSQKSSLIAAGKNPESGEALNAAPEIDLVTQLRAALTRRRSEFLTFTASKP